MIVVDTNLIAYLYLKGEHTQLAEQVVGIDPKWASPILWRSELRSVLMMHVGKKIIPLEIALEIMREAKNMLHGNEHVVSSAHVMELAAVSGCTAYDCEFVALAESLHVPLVTTDKAVLKAFPKTALHPSEFIKIHP